MKTIKANKWLQFLWDQNRWFQKINYLGLFHINQRWRTTQTTSESQRQNGQGIDQETNATVLFSSMWLFKCLKRQSRATTAVTCLVRLHFEASDGQLYLRPNSTKLCTIHTEEWGVVSTTQRVPSYGTDCQFYASTSTVTLVLLHLRLLLKRRLVGYKPQNFAAL